MNIDICSQDGASSEVLKRMRHSAAHVLAVALTDLRPGAKFGVGPTTENGFYYDVEVDPPLKEAELSEIERRMREIVAAGQKFTVRDVGVTAAKELMVHLGQPFKVELIELLAERGSTQVLKDTGDDAAIGVKLGGTGGVETVSIYQVGTFQDLCKGPHVSNTSEIGAFRLTHIAGAYWRGDERRPQLQRVYGLCFFSEDEIEEELRLQALRRERDHRKLGQELEIFAFSTEVGIGLPLWLPNGTVIRKELEKLANEYERRGGYVQVATPEIARGALYYQSGHLPYYKEDMYPPMTLENKEELYLRPMNCPHHHHVYLARPRSYRDLPFRIAEYGKVFRYEAHGALSGLMRTRGFCQNDAHLYCTYDQAKDEFVRVMRMHAEYYDLFGIKEYYMRLSMPDLGRLDKYVNEPGRWVAALEIIREAMKECGLPYKEAEGEAAFYGPKVDFMIRSMVGTEYAISTNQLDFLASTNFKLTYTASDNSEQPVYVIHRAPLGSHERFVAFLLEHFGGAFPTWLAPVQARVIPISDRHGEYANNVMQTLLNADVPTATVGLRIDLDDSGERMQKKIRNAQERKIPYMLVVGDKEAQSRSVSVRHRNGGDLGSMPLDAFLERVKLEIKARRDL